MSMAQVLVMAVKWGGWEWKEDGRGWRKNGGRVEEG